MSVLGITCPFCNEKLEMETYKMSKGCPPKLIVFCSNDNCEIKPMTDATRPPLAFADVKDWGTRTVDIDSNEPAQAGEGS